MDTHDTRKFIYCIDARHQIVSVNDDWRAFAVENGAPALAEAALIGTSLWRYITDATTVHLYRLLLQRLHARGGPLRVPFRCDAPALRRYMELELAPLDDGGVRFTAAVLRLEARAPVPLLDAALQRGGGLLRMCSWCKRVELGDGTWVEVEEAVMRLALFDHAAPPHITHGMCGDCFARLYPPGADDD